MASYHAETLSAARLLLERKRAERGRLSAARVRRSVSTTYYALFHFLLEEATQRVVGTGSPLLRRRRAVARAFTHAGLRKALERVQTPTVHPDLVSFFGMATPPFFAQIMARTFARVRERRHAADYDLNAALSESDARTLILQTELTIRIWRHARNSEDSDFKSAICLLMLLKGDLRGR